MSANRIQDNFMEPILDRNINCHIAKFEKNVTLEHAMTQCMNRTQCAAIVHTEWDNCYYYKTIDRDGALERAKASPEVKGYTIYIKKQGVSPSVK